MKFLRALLLASSLFLISCAAMHDPLQTQLREEIQTIEIAQIEFDEMLRIRRTNPLYLLVGSSGAAVLDTGFVLVQAAKYREKAGDIGRACAKRFKQTLTHQLTRNGYQIKESGLPYWDYFKPRNKSLRKSSDAILRIRLEQVGFWSSGVRTPYTASVIAIAEMVDSKSRKLLYRERLSIGISKKELKILAVYLGNVSNIERPANKPTFRNFRDLLANPESSSSDLIHVVDKAALHISRGLRNPMSGTFVASEEKD